MWFVVYVLFLQYKVSGTRHSPKIRLTSISILIPGTPKSSWSKLTMRR